MYRLHQAAISEYARADPAHLARVVKFVLLTIRQPLHRVGSDLADIEAGYPSTGILWGVKTAGFLAAEYQAKHVHGWCEYIMGTTASETAKACSLIEYLSRLPGLGVVKAGFVAQCAYGLGGCLDTHNMRRFGISPTAFAGIKSIKRSRNRKRKIECYVRLCESLGGPETLWDTWCEYVAMRQPQNYRSPWEVSALHCTSLGLDANPQPQRRAA